MPTQPDVSPRAHDLLTIVSMAVIASALATLLHEGVGHGLTAFVRGDVPMPGAGYFLFSGIFGFGDWNEVIRGLPHHAALRIGMTVGGAALYVLVVRLLAITIRPFLVNRSSYNTVGRMPYYAAGVVGCYRGRAHRRCWAFRCVAA